MFGIKENEMKKLFLILSFMFIASVARAQTQVYTSVSSATWCYIQVSTSVPTQVDNFNGNCEGLLAGRTTLRIINQSGTLHGGFDSNVSTSTTGTTASKYGELISANEIIEMDLSSAMQYYLQSEPAGSGPYIIVQQARNNKKNVGGIGALP